MGKSASPPNAGQAAAAGIQADTQLQPFTYLINSAADTGTPITIGGNTYDFTGLGNADTAGAVSDQMAQTLLNLQTEKSPQLIQNQINQLKAADPQGYAARKELFDKALADAQENPGQPVATELQQQLQDQLAKGVGFDDAREEQQVRDTTRGGQVSRGIYLGNAPVAQEASDLVTAGDSLQQQRQQNAINLLESGASPQDVAYRRLQQSIGNLGAVTNGQTPEAQFGQVSAANAGPVQLTGQSPNAANMFNANAGSQGLSNALGIYGANLGYNASQANPWLSGLSTGATAAGSIIKINKQAAGPGG